MVLPLLFALGGQFLAANAGLGIMGAGLAAAGGNVIGQGIQNGGFDDISWGSAALAGIGGAAATGLGAAAPAADVAKEAAKSGVAEVAKEAGKATAGSAINNVAANAPAINNPFAPTPPPVDFGRMFDTNTMWDTAATMGGQYMENPLAMAAMMGSNAAPRTRQKSGNEKEEQARMQEDWNRAISGAVDHEANYNSGRYGGVTNGATPTPDDVRRYMQSAGVGPYPAAMYRGGQPPLPTQQSRGSRLFRGYADGGAVTPVGIGLTATVDDMQQGNRAEQAMNQTQEMFDIAVMLVTGKLDKDQSQKAFAMLVEALGQEGAMQYLQQVKQATAQGGQQKGRVVAGAPSAQDNVMAQDAQTGEPIKLASGEGILPTPMVEAAGGGIAGVKNIVSAAADRLPQIKNHARSFANNAHT